ncbi:hypothetical protein ACD631_14790 [Alteromonas macleodii]|uniref:hypothetical protein n=1 Tax=Alteromonas macleodii TaxID=28108 RepID=UPI002076B51F|nr:hypothetical protein [Alteromonas macleodii]USI27625.1 hypothetical protein NFG60_18250 [Alteromonas macleodii]
MSNKNQIVRELPLSHTIYLDSEIDAEKAKKLVVYHYPLNKSYRWKEWQEHLDTELFNRYYPYLMRSYKGQFGLFVAVDSETTKPPVIPNKDGMDIRPEKVQYSAEMNPIWIRLIMRKVTAFGTHCKGSHTLGRPLLKIDTWNTKKSTGVNAISLDCRTQQRRDRNTTEVVLFHENVPLRVLDSAKANAEHRNSMWVYDKNNVLVRWIPKKGEKTTGPVYSEIRKNKNKRKQRAFIDLSNADAFKGSWPCLLKPIQDELIDKAQEYGFNLKPKTLNLRPLPLKTKYKQGPKTRNTMPSVALLEKVLVLDLRFSKNISAEQMLLPLNQALSEKSINTQLHLLPDCAPQNIDSLEFSKSDSILVLLDQYPGVIEDHYPLTTKLRTKVACQHINVNPYDLDGDSIEAKLINEISDEESDETYLVPEDEYYNYALSMFETDSRMEALKRNLEIVIKELSIKHLLHDDQVKLSSMLPEERDVLTEELVVITDGYLFTVLNDRPVLIPFNPTISEHEKNCDLVLGKFNTSVKQLFALLSREWPYSYQPQVVMQGFGSDAEKYARFARRQTIVIHKAESVSIYYQDPKYDTPHMLPNHLAETLQELQSQNISMPLKQWQLPERDVLEEHINELKEEGELSEKSANTLLMQLDDIKTCWHEALGTLWQENRSSIEYKELKQHAFKALLSVMNNKLPEGEMPKKIVSSSLSGSWAKVASRVFDIPLQDIRAWLRDIPGIQRLWHDPEQGYYIVGSLAPPKLQLTRQPSIRQWHALQGEMNTELLASLIDVDWVRSNQLAGNPCVALLVRRWRDCQNGKEEALGLGLIK